MGSRSHFHHPRRRAYSSPMTKLLEQALEIDAARALLDPGNGLGRNQQRLEILRRLELRLPPARRPSGYCIQVELTGGQALARQLLAHIKVTDAKPGTVVAITHTQVAAIAGEAKVIPLVKAV